MPYGTIEPDERQFETFCTDYERKSAPDARVEPRDDMKGDLETTLVAVGMTSSKLIENEQGQEDHQRSRRVELRIVPDADRQIGDIIQTLNERDN